MADPLSITASIITVIGAAEGVGKTLTKIRNSRDAPSEVLALINEVSDLRIILVDFENYLNRITETPQSSDLLRHMATLLQRAKDRLVQLDELIQYRLVEPNSTLERIIVSRREWATAKDIIKDYRQSLRDIRLNIIAQMTVLNACYQSRIGLIVEKIYFISDQLLTNQLQAGHQVSQQLGEHSSLLARISNAQLELRNLLQMQLILHERTRTGPVSAGAGSPSPIIGIRMCFPSFERSPCISQCRCSCHNVQRLASPRSVYNILGALFVGYSRYPHMAFRRCNKSNCQGQQIFRTSIVYFFPLWFFKKVLSIRLKAGVTSGIQVSLRIARIVSRGAEIFRMAHWNDVNGLQRLFTQRLASPNDMDIDGNTALEISVFRNSLDVFSKASDSFNDLQNSTTSNNRSSHDLVWDKIFGGTTDRAILDTYRSLFPADDDYIEERQFSKLHKIVLEIASHSLAEELVLNGVHTDVLDLNGATPLIWAVRRKDNAKVNILLEAGADPNIYDASNKSALLYAVESVNLECVTILLKAGSNTTHSTNSGMNALHYAAQNNDNRQLIQCLIDAGAEVNKRAYMGGTPLYYTIFQNHTISAQTLLDCGAEVNVLDNDGDSILHESIFYHANDMIQLLLDHRAIYTISNSIGEPLLHAAGNYGDLRTLEILQAAELKNIDPEALNREGKTAIQVALGRKGVEDGFIEKMKALVADIRVRNSSQDPHSQSTCEIYKKLDDECTTK